MDESLDYIAGSAWFSSLDLHSGYWQVAMAPEDEVKTDFTTRRGLWQCGSMEKVLVGMPPLVSFILQLVMQ